MRELTINTPMWMNRGSVGIASTINEDLCIKINYKDKDGNKVYPHKYMITKDKLLFYKSQKFRKGVPVRVVPIRDLNIIEE